jgi:hypothetical protein
MTTGNADWNAKSNAADELAGKFGMEQVAAVVADLQDRDRGSAGATDDTVQGPPVSRTADRLRAQSNQDLSTADRLNNEASHDKAAALMAQTLLTTVGRVNK